MATVHEPLVTAPEKATGVFGIGNARLPSYCMLALTLIGIADAVYVAHGNYTGAPLWCPILDGCNTVINSPYSRVFGVPTFKSYYAPVEEQRQPGDRLECSRHP
jgi:hypothetical protein